MRFAFEIAGILVLRTGKRRTNAEPFKLVRIFPQGSDTGRESMTNTGRLRGPGA